VTERGATHPHFAAAAPERRWTKSLGELKSTLRQEAFAARGRWVWYVLPHGAFVAMRVNPETMRKELRIGRRTHPPLGAPPVDEQARAKWALELKTFRSYLGAESWRLVEDNYQSAVLVEAARPEPQAPPSCARCGRPAEAGPYKEQLCNACALELGRAESSARSGT
jgi:hypothetical protein